MDDKSIEKLLKKSKLASAYAMLPSPELRRAIAIEYGRLLGENDLSDPMLAGHLRTSILPAVAFHRCLQEYGYTQSASLMAIRAAVLKTPNPWQIFFRGWEDCLSFSRFSVSCALFPRNTALARKDGYLSGNGMMRMQSNGTAAPACMSMCFADTVCRSWHPFSAKVMM